MYTKTREISKITNKIFEKFVYFYYISLHYCPLSVLNLTEIYNKGYFDFCNSTLATVASNIKIKRNNKYVSIKTTIRLKTIVQESLGGRGYQMYLRKWTISNMIFT